MNRPSAWSDLDRLARFVRASDSLTDTLATWTGRDVAVEILGRVDGARPDPLVPTHWTCTTERACRSGPC